MDKKYYSDKHRKYNKRTKGEKSPFILRLNISLGIAIVALGIYKLNNDMSRSLVENYKSLVTENISFSAMRNTIDNLSDLGKSVTAFGRSDDGSITLDDGILEYIKNREDTYVSGNTPAEFP